MRKALIRNGCIRLAGNVSRIDSIGYSYTLSYDANGNLTAKTAANNQTTTYAWDARNRLVGMTGFDNQGGAVSASFKYDALGRRIDKTVNGSTTQYLYDGANAIAELRGNAISAHLLTGLQIDEVIARYSRSKEFSRRALRSSC